MSLVLLGLLNSQAAAAGGAGAFDLIETQVLTTTATSVTFSSLDTVAADYKTLEIRAVARTERADYQDQLAVRLNGATSSYTNHGFGGNGGSISAFATTNTSHIFNSAQYDLPASLETANHFGFAVITLTDFASANKRPIVSAYSGKSQGTQIQDINIWSGFLTNTTNAITSVTLSSRFTSNSDFIAGCRFSLYGWKG